MKLIPLFVALAVIWGSITYFGVLTTRIRNQHDQLIAWHDAGQLIEFSPRRNYPTGVTTQKIGTPDDLRAFAKVYNGLKLK